LNIFKFLAWNFIIGSVIWVISAIVMLMICDLKFGKRLTNECIKKDGISIDDKRTRFIKLIIGISGWCITIPIGLGAIYAEIKDLYNLRNGSS
jgi:hypothetical protein